MFPRARVEISAGLSWIFAWFLLPGIKRAIYYRGSIFFLPATRALHIFASRRGCSVNCSRNGVSTRLAPGARESLRVGGGISLTALPVRGLKVLLGLQIRSGSGKQENRGVRR